MHHGVRRVPLLPRRRATASASAAAAGSSAISSTARRPSTCACRSPTPRRTRSRPASPTRQVLMVADILPTRYEVGVLNGQVATRRRRRDRRRGPDRPVGDHGRAALQPEPRRRDRPRRQPPRSREAVRCRRGRQPGARGRARSRARPHRRPRRRRVDRGGRDPGRVRAHGVSWPGRAATSRTSACTASRRRCTSRTLWIKDVTITTGLVDTYSTPTFLKLLAGHQLDATGS